MQKWCSCVFSFHCASLSESCTDCIFGSRLGISRVHGAKTSTNVFAKRGPRTNTPQLWDHVPSRVDHMMPACQNMSEPLHTLMPVIKYGMNSGLSLSTCVGCISTTQSQLPIRITNSNCKNIFSLTREQVGNGCKLLQRLENERNIGGQALFGCPCAGKSVEGG